MMILKTPIDAVKWLQERTGGKQVKLAVDSRQLGAGDLFVAWPGAAVDGRAFVQEMLNAGIAGCLVEAVGAESGSWKADGRVALYEGLKKDIGLIASLYYEEPSQQLTMLAVTGTNGKTSTSWWLAQALDALGCSSGVVGTMGIGQLHQLKASALTTPDPVLLHQSLREMVSQGVKSCAIEASSIGVEEHRFYGINVNIALLTNVTQDHLDYHKTMQAYWQSKRKLFDWETLDAVVINMDDVHGAQLVEELKASNRKLNVISYSVEKNANATLFAKAVEHTANGICFEVAEQGVSAKICTSLIGQYNVANLLCVLGGLRAMGYKLPEAAKACEAVVSVPGRMQEVFALQPQKTPKVVVDYAHTPDALENVLTALKPIAKARHGQLWCVFGCGGDRDPSKRPLMGAVAQQLADHVVVTSDNPRTEDAQKIIDQIIAGMQAAHFVVQADRQRAIQEAITKASANDLILIAGKGHEAYQEIHGVRYPFSDVVIASQQMNAKNGDNAEQMMTLGQAQALLNAQGIVARLVGNADQPFKRVHSDTRTLCAGDLFVALKGEQYDAHAFLTQAQQQGAVAALAEQGLEKAGLAGLEVANTQLALNALATGWRACFALPVIAVTGSNGKTTTTQMIASILNAWKADKALSTQGNLNNHIGVPLSVLKLRAEHEVAVFELGMNHPGEIQALANLVQPSIGLVNNAQREHLEFMKTVDAVAKENGQVISSLHLDDVAVFPASDEFAPLWQQMAQGRKVVTFALAEEKQSAQADYVAHSAWDGDAWKLKIETPAGDIESRLRLGGQHNVKNAVAAVACTHQAGVPLQTIAQGLDAFVAVSGRSEVKVLNIGEKKITLINDTYNANPDSMRAAIDLLANLPQPSLLVMGEMGEVGDQGVNFHQEIGQYAKEKNIAALLGMGALTKYAVDAFGENGQFFESMEELGAQLQAEITSYQSVLVKGSRYMKMERAVALLEQLEQGGAYVA